MFGVSYQTPLVQNDDINTPPKRPKKPPENVEEWSKSQQEKLKETGDILNTTEHAQWPEGCSEDLSALVKSLPGEGESIDDGGDVFGSLQAIKCDLQEHSPWDSAFLDAVDHRLRKVEQSLNWYADRFICEGHPAEGEEEHQESVAGGLKNITNRTFLTDLCDMDLLTSRHLGSSHRDTRQMHLRGKKSQEGIDSERTVDTLQFSGFGTDMMTSLPAKLEPLPILDLVSKAQIQATQNKSWRKVFFSDASSSLLTNVFWWIRMDYFKPNATVQSTLFDVISENFVALLNNMDDDKYKDVVFMRYPDRLSQAVYSAFCQACPGSNKILNSETFLNYLTNLLSEWITGVKIGHGDWKKWPRYLLDPYHTSANSNNDRPLSSAKGSRPALTDRDVLSLSMSQPPRQHSRQTMSSRVRFKQAKDTEFDKSASRPMIVNRSESAMSTTSSGGWGSPSRSVRVSSSQQLKSASGRGLSSRSGRGFVSHDDPESTPSHIGPGPIFECVRFSTLGRSPLLQHYMIRHGLIEVNAPPGPTISRRQVKEVPRPSVGYKDLLKRSKESSEKHYAEYEKEMASSTQASTTAYKRHISQLRTMEKQNKRILEHRFEVAILAERLVARKKDAQIVPARTSTPEVVDGTNTQM